MGSRGSRPILSIVVVVHGMVREAPRTLFTLSPAYQSLDPTLFEVIVIDNGSPRPLGEAAVREVAENFRYLYREPGDPSPVEALNLGASMCQGALLGFMIDGARMLTPGVLRFAARAERAYQNPVVSCPGYHLGVEPQPISITKGYDQRAEDALLATVDWRADGYELFRVSTPSMSCSYGWFAPIAESNCVFVRPALFEEVGGFHPGFDTPGGGYANLDFYREVCERPGAELVILLGEGTFHQVHGGAMTGKSLDEVRSASVELAAQYRRLRGREFSAPVLRADFLGHVPPSFHRVLDESLRGYERLRKDHGPSAAAQDACRGSPHAFASATSAGRTIVILGMHRSGTSALAGSLEEAGLELGRVVEAAPHNRKGNRENWAILHMQEDLLERSGGSWKDPPPAVQWASLHRAIRDEFVAGFHGSGIWGFKDPRTLFTLDGWREVLPSAELVGIFRHPLLVAGSLHRRDGLPVEDGVQLWIRYNRRLLELHQAAPFPLIEFADDPRDFAQSLQMLAKMLELPGSFRRPTFFEDGLRHRMPLGGEASGAALELYQALRDRVGVADAERRAYRRVLTPKEMTAGHHRKAVGGLWDEIGLLQFEFLRDRGLRSEHRLLDVGCGALRGGVHFIRYLDRGCYFGVDQNATLLAAGREIELPGAGLVDRDPQFLHNDQFEFERFETGFQWALAQSLFTHLEAEEIRMCLVKLVEVLDPGARFCATYFEAASPRRIEKIRHLGGVVSYPDRNPYHYHFSRFEDLVADLPMSVTNLGPWGHPRGQHMLEFVRR